MSQRTRKQRTLPVSGPIGVLKITLPDAVRENNWVIISVFR
jgi:hypothetical protein